MKLWKLTFAIAIVVLTNNAKAVIVADTGLVPCNGTLCSLTSYNSVSRFAGRFSLSETTTINDIQVWGGVLDYQPDSTFTIALYGDDSSLPDTTNEIFAQHVLVTGTGEHDSANDHWEGLSNLDVNLSTGDYWLSVEMRENDVEFHMPILEYGALDPVGPYAEYEPLYSWVRNDNASFAFRIEGNVSSVPLPSPLFLFVSGLISILYFRLVACQRSCA